MGTNIGTRIFTAFRGRPVGKDEQGNRYFEERRAVKGRPCRRWVIYKGEREASRVPPDWHGWLHYTTDTAPTGENEPRRRPWQKGHLPNRTGTVDAYHPPGSEYEAGERAPATGDYEPWRPV